MIVFDAERVDVALFDLIAAYHRHIKAFAKQLRKSRLSGSRSARDDDAVWFFGHVSKRSTPAHLPGSRFVVGRRCLNRYRDQPIPLIARSKNFFDSGS